MYNHLRKEVIIWVKINMLFHPKVAARMSKALEILKQPNTSTQSKLQSITEDKLVAIKKSELVIHNKDGRISQKDSHGHDPHPPKG